MNIKYFFLLGLIFTCPFWGSCQKKAAPDSGDPEFVKQVTHLKEFKESDKRIDSIATKEHMSFKIGLDIIANFSSVGNKENHPTDTSAAFINFDRTDDHIILFIVKFSKKNQKITSIEKNRLGISLAEYGWTDDTH
jgi:hypothetical protein